MRMGISVLGSGSRGNSILLHNSGGGILIDAGFSRKEIISRLREMGLATEMVKALLITHEHSDHVKGCRVLADHFSIPTYISGETCRYLSGSNKLGREKIIFSPGSDFNVSSFRVRPFSVQHDAVQPVGFTVSYRDMKVGVATDLGHLNRLAKIMLADCDALIIEANHDIKMLRQSKRPLSTIRRIMGRHGHLNNDDCVEAFEEIVSEKTRHVFLAHISADCNDRELVKFLASEKLKKIKRTDILLHVLEQSTPHGTVWI